MADGHAGSIPRCRECSPEEFLVIIERKRGMAGFVLLDIRRPDEYSTGHLPGAKNLDFSDPAFEERIRTLPRDCCYGLYCKRGVRASLALELMRVCGFVEVYSLRGGIDGWRLARYPVE